MVVCSVVEVIVGHRLIASYQRGVGDHRVRRQLQDLNWVHLTMHFMHTI